MNNWPVLGALLICLILIGCDNKSGEETVTPRVIKALTLSENTTEQLRVFPARITAGDYTELAFKRAGRLAHLQVREGSHVKAGDVIGMLIDTDAQLRVNDQQNKLQLAERQYQRFRALSTRSAVSQADMDLQKANRDTAAVALNIAKEELDYHTLRAPFDGIVSRVVSQNHQVVAAGQTVAVISRNDLLDVIFSVPENLFTSLEVENASYQPEISLNALPGRSFRAAYKEHRAEADAATLTWQVVLTMPRPADLPQVSGLSGTVKVQMHNLPTASATPLLRVPANAVFNPDRSLPNQPYVWLISGEGDVLNVQLQPVVLGNLSAQGIEIISGLKVGDRIVVAGVSDLRDGQAVRLWTRERGL
ncbi:efflux RND transporter periplasmic adaptor subunit [Pantoea sp. BIGb0393]|uniref:Efflux RND transporter periplasmic adaptor subunit n=1 Tax=Pantoea nemavictus TaxID=2726955 RepID=A0ABU8Q0J8_9GAMM|nr:efflux RND transporter periplasmic adaptor subunit [Pantoea nemavictus]MBA0038831.1 efflux RND transporter periplasmic adaptor subunit [Pantoea nemavictus]